MQNIKIQYIPINSLREAEYNPRQWDEEAKKKLKASLKQHGFVDPVIVNNSPERKNIIVGGHFRTECAKELGFTEVPVVYVSLTKEQEQALNLRLNRTGGSWNFELLKEFDIDLLLNVGFDDGDLSNIWDDILSIEDDKFDPEAAAEEIKNPVTKVGDLYQLGSHQLLCADSTLPASINRLIGNQKIDMIFSDPPYNINFSYNNGLTTQGKYGGKTDDSLSDELYRAFLKATMKQALSVTKPDTHIFYWCDQNYIGMIQSLYQELGINNKRVCLWIKNNFNMTPQVAFNKAYEPCVYGTIGSPYLNSDVTNIHEIVNKEVASGNRCIDDIVDLFDIWLAKRDNAQEYQHPTQKPITLYEKPLRRCTRPGDAVLDLFGGSGTTLLACEQMKRRAFICEKDSIFCDVILRRFEEMTGIKAVKIND
ncbi:MAG: site-specific DNA-methyltransferase [Candidatus Uhrbacteria bacterium]